MKRVTKKPVVGWVMAAPSASGDRIYVIMVWDRWIAYGWGRESSGARGLQFKTELRSSPREAHSRAVDRTGVKECAGYALRRAPVMTGEGFSPGIAFTMQDEVLLQDIASAVLHGPGIQI